MEQNDQTSPQPAIASRKVCSRDSPMPAGDPGFWIHPYAIDVGECLDGCCDYFRCHVCGLRFTVEVAQ